MGNFSYEVDDLDDSDNPFNKTAEVAEELETGDVEEHEDIDFEALGIDPGKPTHAKPGSEEKVLVLTARFAASMPLWHEKDCLDHGPGEAMERLLNGFSDV
jgi:hypothetical protein